MKHLPPYNFNFKNFASYKVAKLTRTVSSWHTIWLISRALVMPRYSPYCTMTDEYTGTYIVTIEKSS